MLTILPASGNKLNDVDLQYTIISGFDSSYDSIVTSLTANITEMSFEDFYSRLLSASQLPPVAHVAQKSTNNGNNSGRQYFQGSSNRSFNQNYRGNNTRMSSSKNLKMKDPANCMVVRITMSLFVGIVLTGLLIPMLRP